ncbi:MAG: hypothetical protein ACOCUV_02625 [bacterium]
MGFIKELSDVLEKNSKNKDDKHSWIIAAIIVAGLAGMFVFWIIPENNKSDNLYDEQIGLSRDLEIIENQIYRAISNNDKEEAFNLLDKLVHPSDLQWNDKVKSYKLGIPFEYYSFNEYWAFRRNELREEISQMGQRSGETRSEGQTIRASETTQMGVVKTEDKATNESYVANKPKVYFYSSPNLNDKKSGYIIEGQSPEIISSHGDFYSVSFTYNNSTTEGYMLKEDLRIIQQTAQVEERRPTANISNHNTESVPSATLNQRYYGLYVLQYANGNTQFFKFSKNPTNEELVILYQDNIGGNVRIENYSLKSFNENLGEAILESKKNTRDITRVTFRRDAQSSSGFKLVDKEGHEYLFVSN